MKSFNHSMHDGIKYTNFVVFLSTKSMFMCCQNHLLLFSNLLAF